MENFRAVYPDGTACKKCGVIYPARLVHDGVCPECTGAGRVEKRLIYRRRPKKTASD